MALLNTINFLPEAFRSDTNQRFLGATMDQLFTPGVNQPVNGYIGRTFAPTYKLGDNYVPEQNSSRANYQLEAGVVVTDDNKNITFTAGYLDLLNSINTNSGPANNITANHRRLFSAESYNYDGHFDYDKFVNYYNYFWLPNGPMSVNVSVNKVPYQATYDVTRSTQVGGYTFSGVGPHPNTQLTLARGGTYTFNVDQPGSQFWIQTSPGVSGLDPNIDTVTTRQVYGVANNGTDNGTVTFKVPLATAQDFYSNMPIVTPSTGSTTVAVSFHYTDVQNQLVSNFLTKFPSGLDGINNQSLLTGTTFIFINNDLSDAAWTNPTDPFAVKMAEIQAANPTGYLSDPDYITAKSLLNSTSGVVSKTNRTSIWKIKLVPLGNDYVMQLLIDTVLKPQQKVFITSGQTYAGNQFWLDNNQHYETVPAITAGLDYLYYQDSNNPGFTGQIKLVDNSTSTLDINADIIGSVGYTSPNGVIFTNGLKVAFDSDVTPATYANNEYYVEGVGTSINLVPVADLIVPEPFGENIETVPDYITINRAAQDLNPWTRYNRWFHRDVITATAEYNNTVADYGDNISARRSIIEFEPNLQLFNYGRQATTSVSYIVTASTDAFNDFEGKTTAAIDGVTLVNGDTVIFANDYDTAIINEVWEVQYQQIIDMPYLTLNKTATDPVLPGENVLVTKGSHAGYTFAFDGSAWSQCQQKTNVNQAPLFDVVDNDGYSFGDTTVYTDSTFAGTKFFGYAQGTGNNDVVLGFPLQYQNFNNIGDIVFSNFYDTDTFTTDAGTINVNTGYIVKNTDLTATTKLTNWVTNVEPTEQFQIFTRFFEGFVIEYKGAQTAFVQIDVLPTAETTVPHLKVYLNNALLVEGVDYVVDMIGVYYAVLFTTMPEINDKIDVKIFSSGSSQIGYYEIPDNLDLNPLNENFDTITLGQIRTHYDKLIENTTVNSTNPIPTQDNYLKKQGGTLRQHSAPLVYALSFLNDPDFSFVDGITLAKKEYTKFKHKFLSLCNKSSDIDYNNPAAGVDAILQSINVLKNSSFPWYYSDMVPQGSSYNEIVYTVLNARQTNYEINSLFDNTVLSNRAILVYVNSQQQILGVDYTFSTVSPTLIFNNEFTAEDVANGTKITIRDYANTDGNYIPETPTKLGLYPKFTPLMYVDNTYQTPTTVIRGHDGSITPAFGDFRDDYLLELELRIYNNIKADYSKNVIDLYDTIPGRFRTGDYSLTEFNQVLEQNFLTWVGTNNVDYTTNNFYDVNNPWTWNYGSFPDVIDGSSLQGSWRAIYNYWFDTDTPNLTPWEMLGFASEPSWWASRYGVGPYTDGNTLLWEDLSNGYIWNNGAPYYDTRFARPGLTGFIPVDSAGNLIDPTQIPLIKTYVSSTASNAFLAGQQSPAEVAWRRSSDYPYAVQMTLALLRPAQYFATQLDTSRFSNSPQTGQFSNSSNRKISPSLLTVNGNTNSTTGAIDRTSGYINWVGDSIKNLGIDPVSTLIDYFSNLSVRLNYKVAGFTDKNLITVSAEQTSPGSTSGSIIIPDTNYQVYLNKSVPIGSAVYSAVIVEKTSTGWSVTGYDPTNPFFNIVPSVADSNAQNLTVNGTTIKLYQSSSNTVSVVPYGTVYSSIQQVADFILSYQRYLNNVGFRFETFNTDLQAQQDWLLSIQELLYWSQQGWNTTSVIVLNPVATSLELAVAGAIVDEVTNTSNGSKILDQNFAPIKSNNFNIVRTNSAVNGNKFTISTLNGSTICYAKLNLTSYEHVLVFDNVDDFGDIIYVPDTGTRQYRLKIAGSKTGAWDGSLSAAGYIYSDPIIDPWQPGTDYQLGDIVQYNNFYYTATQNISASVDFNPVLWTQISYDSIQTGLLPSFSLNAQEFTNFYDVDNPPTDETFQKYSAGLLGFRQRSYLTDLGISIPTQTKFYQGYIKQKGTMEAITALTKANFNNVNGNVNVYEEWAFNVGKYGNLNNNIYKDFILDQSVFKTNPVVFTSDGVYNAGNIIVSLNGNALSSNSNVYTSSNTFVGTTTLYNNRTDLVYITDLPDVGYMNINDVDYTLFDITKPNSLNVATLGGGDKVWVAKDINGNWDILRTNESNIIAESLTFILDSNAQLLFNTTHKFSVGDIFVLKDFNPTFDGVYEVVSAPTPTSVVIQINNIQPNINTISPLQTLIRALVITGSGIVYTLDSARIGSLGAFPTHPVPINGWLDGDRIWVDNASTAGWGVYTFNHPWLANTAVRVTGNTTANGRFGSTIRVSADNTFVFAGSPASRQVFAEPVKSGSTVTISVADSGFGQSIDSQGNLLTVASTSNVYLYRQNGNVITALQTIISGNLTGNVTSISMSADQTWLYIGGNNAVHAYTANTTPSSANVSYVWAGKITGTGSFGNVIRTNNNGTTLFVGAPTANNIYSQNGNVYVYSRSGNTLTNTQTLSSQHKNQSAGFGTSISIDATAGNVYIGVPGSTVTGFLNGAVERYVLTGGSYVYNQTLNQPETNTGAFGTSVSISGNGQVLAIGSVGSAVEEHTTFDNTATTIDTNTTHFVEYISNSGATYLFEPVGGAYVYTQQLEAQLYSNDLYGTAVDATNGTIAVGAPGTLNNYGAGYVFANPTQTRAWIQTRTQMPIVDTDSISRTFVYNKTNNNLLAALDYIDPAKGKILNAFGQDIDFQRATDPALYNAGNNVVNKTLHWGPNQVGTIWWDLSTVRYINYEQDALIYRLNHWGETFPGSSIDVYQWIASSQLPSEYTGSGTPMHPDNSAYSTYGYVTPTGAINLTYYYWVKNIQSVDKAKQNSVYSIAEAIKNPQSQGIPYINVLRNDTVAAYNINNLLVGQSSVIELGTLNVNATETALVHSEYALVQEGNPRSQLPTLIVDKINDSISGIDAVGNPVPDPALPPSQAYGISIRPRQSAIIDVNTALYNIVTLVNSKLIAYPVTERKVLTTLNSSELYPVAGSGYYSISVNIVDELEYIDTNTISTGYQVLVLSDTNNLGKWAIYRWTGTAWTVATRPDGTTPWVQLYKTNLYWSYADWYAEGFDPTTTIDVVVANNLELGKLTLQAGTYVEVADDGNGNFVIYYINKDLSKTTVGIQNGTIQLPGAETNIPDRELRQILVALHKEIFIDDLAAEYNEIFFTMIKYILSEQKNVDWVFKTSFVSATQSIRKLQQFPSYIPDNQNFYLDYIDEVKPYRTVVREFVVDYLGNDEYGSDITDFDLPPYWDTNLKVYRSPSGEQSYDANTLSTTNSVYSQWYNSYKYQVVNAIIDNPGSGYLTAPQVVITGDQGSGATAYAVLGNNGAVSQIVITNSGSGYTTIPEIIINGTGSGAKARAVLKNLFNGNNAGHNLVRSLGMTLTYDRVTYANVTYPGVIVDGGNLRTYADGTVTFGSPASNVAGGFDATISSSYTSSLGVNPADIIVDGGAYVGPFSSYAPEELVPGRMFDSLNMQVFSNVNPGTNDYAFRIFTDMNQATTFYRIAAANTTTLASNLHITDSNIYVVNSSVLPIPNPTLAIPGVVFIGGEKITYYTNDTVNNVLGQIRRAVDGTGVGRVLDWVPKLNIATGSLISFGSNSYITTGNVYGVSWTDTSVQANVTYYGSAYIHSAGTRVVDASLDQVVPLTSQTTANVGAANVTYTNTAGNTITVLANTVVYKDLANWYDTDTANSRPSFGNGLINSTTVQAKFLLASPGYTP